MFLFNLWINSFRKDFYIYKPKAESSLAINSCLNKDSANTLIVKCIEFHCFRNQFISENTCYVHRIYSHSSNSRTILETLIIVCSNHTYFFNKITIGIVFYISQLWVITRTSVHRNSLHFFTKKSPLRKNCKGSSCNQITFSL